MQIRIDNSSERPVYQQIIDQIKRDIALGRLLMGEQLATVRQLASLLAINPNTIAKAYRLLEREGIITTRPGAGAFVADLSTNLSRAVRKKLVCEDMERIVVDAVHMQIDRETLTGWFEETAEKFRLGEHKKKG